MLAFDVSCVCTCTSGCARNEAKTSRSQAQGLDAEHFGASTGRQVWVGFETRRTEVLDCSVSEKTARKTARQVCSNLRQIVPAPELGRK